MSFCALLCLFHSAGATPSFLMRAFSSLLLRSRGASWNDASYRHPLAELDAGLFHHLPESVEQPARALGSQPFPKSPYRAGVRNVIYPDVKRSAAVIANP